MRPTGGNIGLQQAQRTRAKQCHCHSYGPPCHRGVPRKHLCEEEAPQNHSVERSEGEPVLDLCFAELMELSSRLESKLPCLSRRKSCSSTGTVLCVDFAQ